MKIDNFDGSGLIHQNIGGGNGGPWPLLNLRPLHRTVIFAIENHFSLAKWPPYFQWFPPPVRQNFYFVGMQQFCMCVGLIL